MPTYNHFILDKSRNLSPLPLRLAGPSLQVEISFPEILAQKLISEGTSPPAPIMAIALIDTGASQTCVDYKTLDKLKIKSVGATRVYTPSGPAIQRKYPCTLSFPSTPLPKLEFSSVIGSDLDGQKIGVLIGRDVLTNFVLIYNGPAGMYTLSY